MALALLEQVSRPAPAPELFGPLSTEYGELEELINSALQRAREIDCASVSIKSIRDLTVPVDGLNFDLGYPQVLICFQADLINYTCVASYRNDEWAVSAFSEMTVLES